MATISATCPHCFVENTSFQCMAAHKVVHEKKVKMYTVAFSCNKCGAGLMASVEMTGMTTTPPNSYPAGLDMTDHYKIHAIYPLPKPIDIPDHLPDNIRSFFMQAQKALRDESWDAAAMMSRKSLETTCKKLDPDFSGNLMRRIDNLANNHIITESLKEWAHEIRIDGNVAAHEEEPVTDDFAKELVSFTELFLMYAFTLPGMLDARRNQRENNNDS